MNLIPNGRFGWRWTMNGITFYTDKEGNPGLWRGWVLVNALFVAPRSRLAMIKFLAKGEL